MSVTFSKTNTNTHSNLRENDLHCSAVRQNLFLFPQAPESDMPFREKSDCIFGSGSNTANGT